MTNIKNLANRKILTTMSVVEMMLIFSVFMTTIPVLGMGFSKDGITKTTEEALGKIAQAAE
jgi:hypothetical protein